MMRFKLLQINLAGVLGLNRVVGCVGGGGGWDYGKRV